jgi:L-alanine-DL-glutamate epimerase-like enolase superfamily enzyme
MKITAVDVVLVDEPAQDPPFSWRHGLPGSDRARTSGWLVITTEDGTQGFAYGARGAIVADVVARRIREELVGIDALSREYVWHRLWELDRIEEFPIYIHGLVDVALWDVAGKHTGLPVHQLIGNFRNHMPAYASTVTFSKRRSTSTSRIRLWA